MQNNKAMKIDYILLYELVNQLRSYNNKSIQFKIQTKSLQDKHVQIQHISVNGDVRVYRGLGNDDSNLYSPMNMQAYKNYKENNVYKFFIENQVNDVKSLINLSDESAVHNVKQYSSAFQILMKPNSHHFSLLFHPEGCLKTVKHLTQNEKTKEMFYQMVIHNELFGMTHFAQLNVDNTSKQLECARFNTYENSYYYYLLYMCLIERNSTISSQDFAATLFKITTNYKIHYYKHYVTQILHEEYDHNQGDSKNRKETQLFNQLNEKHCYNHFELANLYFFCESIFPSLCKSKQQQQQQSNNQNALLQMNDIILKAMHFVTIQCFNSFNYYTFLFFCLFYRYFKFHLPNASHFYRIIVHYLINLFDWRAIFCIHKLINNKDQLVVAHSWVFDLISSSTYYLQVIAQIKNNNSYDHLTIAFAQNEIKQCVHFIENCVSVISEVGQLKSKYNIGSYNWHLKLNNSLNVNYSKHLYGCYNRLFTLLYNYHKDDTFRNANITAIYSVYNKSLLKIRWDEMRDFVNSNVSCNSATLHCNKTINHCYLLEECLNQIAHNVNYNASIPYNNNYMNNLTLQIKSQCGNYVHNYIPAMLKHAKYIHNVVNLDNITHKSEVLNYYTHEMLPHFHTLKQYKQTNVLSVFDQFMAAAQSGYLLNLFSAKDHKRMGRINIYDAIFHLHYLYDDWSIQPYYFDTMHQYVSFLLDYVSFVCINKIIHKEECTRNEHMLNKMNLLFQMNWYETQTSTNNFLIQLRLFFSNQHMVKFWKENNLPLNSIEEFVHYKIMCVQHDCNLFHLLIVHEIQKNIYHKVKVSSSRYILTSLTAQNVAHYLDTNHQKQ